jgi:hypothetical protein
MKTLSHMTGMDICLPILTYNIVLNGTVAKEKQKINIDEPQHDDVYSRMHYVESSRRR